MSIYQECCFLQTTEKNPFNVISKGESKTKAELQYDFIYLLKLADCPLHLIIYTDIDVNIGKNFV